MYGLQGRMKRAMQRAGGQMGGGVGLETVEVAAMATATASDASSKPRG
jgi:hypothetical protein